MKIFGRYYLLLLSIAFLFACQTTEKKYKIEPNPKTLTIVTFNTEWLGDGINDTKPRSARDYELMARMLSTIQADIIALQEVENENALKKVCDYIDGYDFYVCEDKGRQNPAFLVSDKISFNIFGSFRQLIVEPNKTRPGFIAEAKKGNFDFTLMNIHLKSTSRYDSTPELKKFSQIIRTRQAYALKGWIDSMEHFSKERDYIILGDFNDNPKKKSTTLYPLSEDRNIKFLTEFLKSTKNYRWLSIDHILVSNAAEQRIIQNSLHQIDFYDLLKTKDSEKISDHTPVVLSFEISSNDND
ncbi:MAG: hypothetical protein A2X64_05420 [Ignavibacteria bacterium GWF2_33_9]|nr:MAG: hypothetical protein A2X64_05420 [Ignavibacteria bacterium GWF2_33_9]